MVGRRRRGKWRTILVGFMWRPLTKSLQLQVGESWSHLSSLNFVNDMIPILRMYVSFMKFHRPTPWVETKQVEIDGLRESDVKSKMWIHIRFPHSFYIKSTDFSD
jgi:hypothetical protein